MSIHKVIVDNDAKDNYIADLRAENYELKQRERTFYALNDRITDADHRLNLVKESRARLADEMDKTAESDMACIRANEHENADLDKALADKKIDFARLERELFDLRAISENQSADIHNLNSELADKENANRALRGDLHRLEGDLKGRDHELADGKDNQANLERLLTSKDLEFADRVKQLDDANNEVCHLDNDYAQLCDDNDGLDIRLKNQLVDNDKLRSANDHEGARNDDYAANLYLLEAQLREKDNHLAVLHKEADDLSIAYDRSQVLKNHFGEKLHALNKHVSQSADQNNRMASELNFISDKARDVARRFLAPLDQNTRASLSGLGDIRSISPSRVSPVRKR
jgi:chromosome segregation ATPase